MDKIVQQIQGQSSTKKDLKSLRDWLKKQDGTLSKNKDRLLNALGALDPRVHALGMLFIFNAVPEDVDDIAGFADAAVNFLLMCDVEQACTEPRLVARLASNVRSVCCSIGAPLKAVTALRRAILVLQEADGGASQLTVAHSDLVYCCLHGNFPSAALPTLSRDVLSIGDEPKKAGFTHVHYLSYFYYGGLVYCALKKFNKAKTFFERCFSLPAVMLSQIALDAYKKHVLVSLLVKGQVDIKRPNNSSSYRQMKAMTVAYQELATAFSTKDFENVSAVLAAHLETFAADGNMGLAKQVLQSLYDRQIRSYTETYVTLSLQALADGAKLKSVEVLQGHLLKLCSQGRLHASINEKEGMVSFSEAPYTFDDTDSAQRIHGSISGVIGLGDKLRQLNENIALSSDYIQRTTHEGPGGRGGPEGAMMAGMMMQGGGFAGGDFGDF